MKNLCFFITLIICCISCKTDIERKNYSEIQGLWQYRHPQEEDFTYMGCYEFIGTGVWRRHDGCTQTGGEYWFENDTLFLAEPDHIDFRRMKIERFIVLELDNGNMTTLNQHNTDTVYYQRTANNDGNSCWSFSY